MKKVLLLLLIVISITNASAVEIYGKIYRWDTLDVVNNVVVEIRDDAVQRMVSENGEYRFNVTPGNYMIIAQAGEYYAVENVTVESSMRFDLILFPKLEDVEEIPDFPAVEEQEEEFPYYIIAIFASGFVLATLFFIKIRSGKQPPTVEWEIKPTEHDLPEDLAEVVEIIAKEGGRITQKELRKRLGYSEAKMSLIIADLERRGIVEKVKKGRGNIIFLKEKP
ncbi:MAG: winged helix-turn-helix transcriptional regulator [Archaeoglobus sp.]|uniref:helix-turn-helix transcriptional regulator n=1 Tax=Archaeoglobus sp. TaxID=1872626 RepID=UPI001D4C5805|nr:MarR family transcriptional regulator [Archaeoglobus sp.]MBO8179594.1 winged helix-turn-helix transcriptional regulator [Archaeoglobus sp.]